MVPACLVAPTCVLFYHFTNMMQLGDASSSTTSTITPFTNTLAETAAIGDGGNLAWRILFLWIYMNLKECRERVFSGVSIQTFAVGRFSQISTG